MDMADIARDPHYAAREAIVELDGTPMQGLIARLSATPGVLRWAGRPLDADGAEIRASGWGGPVADQTPVPIGHDTPVPPRPQ
jgi:crotonobetainyl-CoA:carnitine CoA-transferase CaiB-like acyl-CoA transferase